MTTVLDELDKRGIENVEIAVSGEMGLSVAEPIVRVEDKSGEQVTYGNVSPAAARRIVADHLAEGRVVDGLAIGKVKQPERAK